MKIKAKVSFCGVLSMGKGEVREYSDQAVISDLLRAGYVEEVKEAPAPVKEEKAAPAKGKAVKSRDSK